MDCFLEGVLNIGRREIVLQNDEELRVYVYCVESTSLHFKTSVNAEMT